MCVCWNIGSGYRLASSKFNPSICKLYNRRSVIAGLFTLYTNPYNLIQDIFSKALVVNLQSKDFIYDNKSNSECRKQTEKHKSRVKSKAETIKAMDRKMKEVDTDT